MPPGNSVIFGLVETSVRIGTVRLFDCWRLGNLKTDDGPLLMDAQACHIEGDAEILLGSRRSAAAIRIRHDHGTTVIILDAAFLGQNAPMANREWLIQTLELL